MDLNKAPVIQKTFDQIIRISDNLKLFTKIYLQIKVLMVPAGIVNQYPQFYESDTLTTEPS